MCAKEILKDFKPDRKHFGQLIFVDEKLRVFANNKLPKLFNSPRKGFLVEVEKQGRFKPLNPYKDPHKEILARTLRRLLKSKREIEGEIKKCQRAC